MATTGSINLRPKMAVIDHQKCLAIPYAGANQIPSFPDGNWIFHDTLDHIYH